VYFGGSPPILYVPMEICFFSTKWERSEEINKRVKRELFTQGEVLVLVCSLEVWEHPWAHSLKFRGRHSTKNLRCYNIICNITYNFPLCRRLTKHILWTTSPKVKTKTPQIQGQQQQEESCSQCTFIITIPKENLLGWTITPHSKLLTWKCPLAHGLS